jgi:hypothetical protein
MIVMECIEERGELPAGDGLVIPEGYGGCHHTMSEIDQEEEKRVSRRLWLPCRKQAV